MTDLNELVEELTSEVTEEAEQSTDETVSEITEEAEQSAEELTSDLEVMPEFTPVDVDYLV
jgi:hypothetical protein